MWTGQAIAIEGDPPTQGPERNLASCPHGQPAVLRDAGYPDSEWRAFTATDGSDAVPVCIVSEAFVQRYLNGRNPIGLRVVVPAMGFPMRPVLREIVGVARRITMFPGEPQPTPQLYVPIAQNSWYRIARRKAADRVRGGTATGGARRCRSSRPGQPITRVRTIDVVAAEATSRPRFRAVLVGTFAALALLLAMVGVFGVLACSVQQRVREFGVRIAIGAGSSDVVRLVLGNALKLTLIGLGIGLTAAALLSRYVTTAVYPVRPLDPATFIAVYDRPRHHRRNRGGRPRVACCARRSSRGVQGRVKARSEQIASHSGVAFTMSAFDWRRPPSWLWRPVRARHLSHRCLHRRWGYG